MILDILSSLMITWLFAGGLASSKTLTKNVRVSAYAWLCSFYAVILAGIWL